jgi:hypothetical protein
MSGTNERKRKKDYRTHHVKIQNTSSCFVKKICIAYKRRRKIVAQHVCGKFVNKCGGYVNPPLQYENWQA